MKITPAVTMLLIATVLQNVASTTAYAGYGIAMPSLIEEFGINRSTAALGTSLLALISALASPLIGKLIDRWSLRNTALLGALCGAAGLGLAALAPQFSIFLIGFSLLGGLGNVGCGSLTSSTLASRWFPGRTGTAVAICMLPIVVSVGPPLFGWILGQVGWRGLFSVFAGMYVFLLLPAAFIRNRPADATPAQGQAAAPTASFSAIALLRQATFWYLLLAIGILFSTSVTLISHVVTAAVEMGAEKSYASILISVVGISGALGGLAFGWLSDRISPALALATIAAGSSIGWILLGLSPSFTLLAASAALTSFCGGATVISPLSAFIAHTYGRAIFGQVFGLIKQLTLPLLFAGPVVIGALYDWSHGYRFPFLFVAMLCALAMILLLVVQRRTSTAAAAATALG